MRCDEVAERLVAFADGELSPGEATFVAEHLDGCDACAALDLGLRDVTPQACLVVPPEVLARMHAAVDAAIDAEFERSDAVVVPARQPAARWARWLRRDRDMSNGAVLGYAMLLAACLGWGISNWMVVQELQGEPTPARTARTDVDTQPRATDAAIPHDQYRPASFSPADDSEEWR